jgi:hypothetical protein
MIGENSLSETGDQRRIQVSLRQRGSFTAFLGSVKTAETEETLSCSRNTVQGESEKATAVGCPKSHVANSN